ncbi:UDP-N-acetylmuramate--L-alanine ligase [Candidatus Protochlamydia sp. W-9]|uniref:UDP-N-acetylmuramate--L-alanine ligase n=1 Tax=Candidatus Protochlamydia sp. W-9 TaxID=1785087 RepID=UPI00096A3EFB|nr:UDP-N-acetylmuramate--L-alanine ligase [Candidatus Protochlamydia sp. W-9]
MRGHYHFIGIGGIGMSGLARILLQQNLRVSGSDIAFNYIIEELIKSGATIYKGHSPSYIASGSTVIYSSDIKTDNPEYLAAKNLQCSLLHRAELLALLTRQKKSLAVTGTHGKTTTSSLLATTLLEANCDPSFAVGGVIPQFQSNAKHGLGDLFVFEADESDRSFLKYFPYGAIVTNIDNDHLNSYENSEDVLIQSFQQFTSQISSPNHLFWCGDDTRLKFLNGIGQSYGFGEHCNWRISNIFQKNFNLEFDLEGNGKKYSSIKLNLIGRHNLFNGAAVFGLAMSLNISEASIRHTFERFCGVLRRCEYKGEFENTIFLDDYAHHPTEIQTTLEGIRKAIKSKRLIAVFQPHRFSRIKDCLGMYGKIFNNADEVFVTDVYGAGEMPIEGISQQQIIQEISENSTVPVKYVPRTALGHKLSEFIQPLDVIVTLGAGDVTKVASETLSLLENGKRF